MVNNYFILKEVRGDLLLPRSSKYEKDEESPKLSSDGL